LEHSVLYLTLDIPLVLSGTDIPTLFNIYKDEIPTVCRVVIQTGVILRQAARR